MKEKDAAQFLANCLVESYGVMPTVAPDIWRQYGNYMQRRFRLTDREAQVAVEVIRGRANLEIATRLAISAETVNKHIDAIFTKALIRSRSELSALVLEAAAKFPQEVF